MSSNLDLRLTIDRNEADITSKILGTTLPREQFQNVENILKSIRSGAFSGKMRIQKTPDIATGTLTCVSAVEDNTITVGTITFTIKDSPSGIVQIDTGSSDTIMAANIVAAINAHTTTKYLVKATSAAGVVTLTSIHAGLIGNQIALSTTGGTITASAAYLASGADTGIYEYDLGID